MMSAALVYAHLHPGLDFLEDKVVDNIFYT